MLTQAFSQDISEFLFPEHSKKNGISPLSGRFSISPIPGMQAQQAQQDQDTLVLTGHTQNSQVMITMKRIKVAPSAQAMQMALNARDTMINQLPNFAVDRLDRFLIAGHSAARLIGHYDYLGNKAYPIVTEDAFTVDGEDGFLIHTEVPMGLYAAVTPAMQSIYNSFVFNAALNAAPTTAIEKEAKEQDGTKSKTETPSKPKKTKKHTP